MNNTKKRQRLLFIGIPVILLLIGMWFGLYFFKTDGFSGLSAMLPVLLLCFIVFALCTSTFFAAWVWQDCKKRGEDPIVWAAVVFIATPFIGLLIYFLRRSEIKRSCPSCNHQISLRANYCEECGTYIENKKEDLNMAEQRTHHLGFIVAGAVSMVVMLACLTGFIVSAAGGNRVNTDVASNERVWNYGMISMNSETFRDGVWKLDFKSAGSGFVKEEKMTIEDADTQMLHADISCGTVPDGATLVLWLVQGDRSQSIDVTDFSKPLEYPLNGFENKEIYVRLQINGVEDTTSEIYIK